MSDSKLLSMWDKDALARNTPTPEVTPAGVEATEEEDECVAFGYLRGIRDRALFLELRFADGDTELFPYGWLGPSRYKRSAGLLLRFVGDLTWLVLLEGSNLKALVNGAVSLYSGIQRHRVTWIREMSREELADAGKGEVMVERFRIVAFRAGEEPKGLKWLEPFQKQAR